MIRIWFYTLMEKYYAYCLHKWVDIYGETRTDQALAWADHYKYKLGMTESKKEAYKHYISLKRL